MNRGDGAREALAEPGFRSGVDVWCRLTDDDAPAPSVEAMATLSEEERRRAARFIVAGDRRDFIAAHLLTRRALTAMAGRSPQEWEFVASASGKPAVVASQAGAPPLLFNLSHTRGLVACAVTRAGEVGIDVERADRTVDSRAIAARYFAAAEVSELESLPVVERRRRFVELWSLKEACFKAVGSGLAGGLSAVSFSFPATTGLVCSDGRWHFLLAAIGTPDAQTDAGATNGLLAVAWLRTAGGAHVVIHRPAGNSVVEVVRWTDRVTFSVED